MERSRWLVTYHPICEKRGGAEVAAIRGWPPFVDSSHRAPRFLELHDPPTFTEALWHALLSRIRSTRNPPRLTDAEFDAILAAIEITLADATSR